MSPSTPSRELLLAKNGWYSNQLTTLIDSMLYLNMFTGEQLAAAHDELIVVSRNTYMLNRQENLLYINQQERLNRIKQDSRYQAYIRDKYQFMERHMANIARE